MNSSYSQLTWNHARAKAPTLVDGALEAAAACSGGQVPIMVGCERKNLES
jgi:hypothetical protein